MIDSDDDGKLDPEGLLKKNVSGKLQQTSSLAAAVTGQPGYKPLKPQDSPITPAAQKTFDTIGSLLTAQAKNGINIGSDENPHSRAIWNDGLKQVVEQVQGQDYLDLLEIPFIKNSQFLTNAVKYHHDKPLRDAAAAAEAQSKKNVRTTLDSPNFFDAAYAGDIE
jgi:hypothetical protein